MRLQTLDLMRFFAALGVVIYHYSSKLNPSDFAVLIHLAKFGYLGVPLFFMISGFVIFASAERRSPWDFLISRASRLYPALLVCVSFTTLMLWWDGHRTPITQYLFNLTLLNDYLRIPNIDGVYWTLQAELKFYGCVFLLLLFDVFSFIRVWISVWLAITLVYNLTSQPFFMGWFISPSYSCYFISGIASYLLWKNNRSRFAMIVLLLSSVLCVVQSYNQAFGFMSSTASTDPFVAPIAVLLFHGLFLLIAFNKIQLGQWAFYSVLGGITYPLYLIHGRAGKIVIDGLANYMPMIWAVVLTACLMLVAAYVIYRYIETPLIKRFKSYLEKGLISVSAFFNRVLTRAKAVNNPDL